MSEPTTTDLTASLRGGGEGSRSPQQYKKEKRHKEKKQKREKLEKREKLGTTVTTTTTPASLAVTEMPTPAAMPTEAAREVDDADGGGRRRKKRVSIRPTSAEGEEEDDVPHTASKRQEKRGDKKSKQDKKPSRSSKGRQDDDDVATERQKRSRDDEKEELRARSGSRAKETEDEDNDDDVMSDIDVLPLSTHATPATGLLAHQGHTNFEFPELPPAAAAADEDDDEMDDDDEQEENPPPRQVAETVVEEEEEDVAPSPPVKKERKSKAMTDDEKKEKAEKKKAAAEEKKKAAADKKQKDAAEKKAAKKDSKKSADSKKYVKQSTAPAPVVEAAIPADERFTILVLGAPNAGKTVLASRCVPTGTVAESFRETAGTNSTYLRLDQWHWPVTVETTVDEEEEEAATVKKQVELTFQDVSQLRADLATGGAARNSASHANSCLSKVYAKWKARASIRPDAVLLVADSQHRESFAHLNEWLTVLKAQSYRLGKTVDVPSIFLVETKCDAKDSVADDDDDSAGGEADEEEGEQEEEEWDASGRSVSASPNRNVGGHTQKKKKGQQQEAQSSFFESLRHEHRPRVKGCYSVSSFTNQGITGMVTSILRQLKDDAALKVTKMSLPPIIGGGGPNGAGGGDHHSSAPGANSLNKAGLVNLPRQLVGMGQSTLSVGQLNAAALSSIPRDLHRSIRINGDIFALDGLALGELETIASPTFGLEGSRKKGGDGQRGDAQYNTRIAARVAVDELFGDFVFLKCIDTDRINLPSSSVNGHTTLVVEGFSYQTVRFSQHHIVVAGRIEAWEPPAFSISQPKAPGQATVNKADNANALSTSTSSAYGRQGFSTFVHERAMSAPIVEIAQEWATLSKKEKEVYARMTKTMSQ